MPGNDAISGSIIRAGAGASSGSCRAIEKYACPHLTLTGSRSLTTGSRRLHGYEKKVKQRGNPASRRTPPALPTVVCNLKMEMWNPLCLYLIKRKLGKDCKYVATATIE